VLCRREILKKRLKAGWYWIALWACRVFCVLFFRVCVYGRENVPDEGAFVLVCNHQSFLDPLFCGTPLRRQLVFLARADLWKSRVLGWMISSVGTIPAKRSEADLPAMRNIISKLKEGEGICLFPEATRTKDGKIAPFKHGFSLLCRRGEAAVVPVVIDGAFECWPRYRKVFLFAGRIVVSYGEVITAEQVKDMNNRELTEVLTNTLRRMQNESRVKQGKEPYSY